MNENLKKNINIAAAVPMMELDKLFYPNSIAIIGASKVPVKPGGYPVFSLRENKFRGKIYLVNPRYDKINDMKCYNSIEDIDDAVDMSIVAVPSDLVLDVIKSCVKKKVRSIIILTSGFSESDSNGKEIQNQIAKLTHDNNILLCGPNSQGIFNFLNGMSAGFAITKLNTDYAKPNMLGFVSQSGGFGTAAYLGTFETGIGMSYFISSGNEAGVAFADYILYLINDHETKIIGGYLEGVKDGKKLMRAAALALKMDKPLLLIKSGKTDAAAKAALSHTGSIVGSEKIFQALVKQKAIIRPDNMEEFNIIKYLLVYSSLPKSNRVLIIAASGGSGVLMSDKCVEAGLDVVSLSPKTREKLNVILPSYGSSANPVDLTSQILLDPELLSKSLHIAIDDPNIDMMLVEYWPGDGTDTSILKKIVEVSKMSAKPVFVFMQMSESFGQQDIKYLRKFGVAAARSQDVAAKALGAFANYSVRKKNIAVSDNRQMPAFNPDIDKVKNILSNSSDKSNLSEYISKKVLEAYNIKCTREKIIFSNDEAIKFADEIGYPVVLKINSDKILHKTEFQGVCLSLNSEKELRKAYSDLSGKISVHLPEEIGNGMLIQEMITGGIECVVGALHDVVYGPVVMFGPGGIYVELLNNSSVRLCPLAELDINEMISETIAGKIISGYRGKGPYDREAVFDIILKISRLAADFPQIKAIDINPLIVLEKGKGAIVADALMVIDYNTGQDEFGSQPCR